MNEALKYFHSSAEDVQFDTIIRKKFLKEYITIDLHDNVFIKSQGKNLKKKEVRILLKDEMEKKLLFREGFAFKPSGRSKPTYYAWKWDDTRIICIYITDYDTIHEVAFINIKDGTYREIDVNHKHDDYQNDIGIITQYDGISIEQRKSLINYFVENHKKEDSFQDVNQREKALKNINFITKKNYPDFDTALTDLSPEFDKSFTFSYNLHNNPDKILYNFYIAAGYEENGKWKENYSALSTSYKWTQDHTVETQQKIGWTKEVIDYYRKMITLLSKLKDQTIIKLLKIKNEIYYYQAGEQYNTKLKLEVEEALQKLNTDNIPISTLSIAITKGMENSIMEHHKEIYGILVQTEFPNIHIYGMTNAIEMSLPTFFHRANPLQ